MKFEGKTLKESKKREKEEKKREREKNNNYFIILKEKALLLSFNSGPNVQIKYTHHNGFKNCPPCSKFLIFLYVICIYV